jgi:hypothetical protein
MRERNILTHLAMQDNSKAAVADSYLHVFVIGMDVRNCLFCRPSLDDPDRAKTQGRGEALCSDLAITAAAPSGWGKKPC